MLHDRGNDVTVLLMGHAQFSTNCSNTRRLEWYRAYLAFTIRQMNSTLLWWCELDSLCATPHYVFLLQSTWTQRRNITIEKRALRLERQRGSPMFVNCDEARLYCVSPTNVVQRYSWMRSRSQVVNVLLEPNMSKSCACSNWSYPQRQKWHRIWSSS